MVRWVKGKIKTQLLFTFTPLDVFTVGTLMYVRPGPACKYSCQAFNKLDNHLFLHSTHLYIEQSQKTEVAKHSVLQNTTQ